MAKMNQEAKRLWVEALRDGSRKQTTGKLYDGDGGYCCLGVLCEVSPTGPEWIDREKEGQEYPDNSDFRFAYAFENEAEVLPLCVQTWAGLDKPDPKIGELSASEWNDEQKLSFEEIAELIEKEL